MPPPPPSQGELEALAERALAAVAGDGQATAWWERTVRPGAVGDAIRVELLAACLERPRARW